MAEKKNKDVLRLQRVIPRMRGKRIGVLAM